MAMSFPHQIGSLSGTSIIYAEPTTSGSDSPLATSVSASVWRSSVSSLRPIQKQLKQTEMERVSPSPPLSPRCDLSVACQALMEEAATINTEVVEREYGEVVGAGAKERGVPVFVMMPLDSVTMGNTVNRRKAMNASMQALKSAGAEGIMMDVWWGLIERTKGR